MKNLFLLACIIAIGVVSCSKSENLAPSENERNTMEMQSSAFVSEKYTYTDPGVVLNGTVIVPPSQKQRHSVIEFKNDGKTYKSYFSASGSIGFPYDESATTLPYTIDFPKLSLQGQTVSVYKNNSDRLEFKLENLTYTAISK